MDFVKHMLEHYFIADHEIIKIEGANLQTNEITINTDSPDNIVSIIDGMSYKVKEADVILNGINIGTVTNGEFSNNPSKPKESKPDKKIRSIIKLRRPEKP